MVQDGVSGRLCGKTIERVVANVDRVLLPGFKDESDSDVLRLSCVKGVYNFLIDKYVQLYLSNGNVIECTLDHPFYIKNKGLCAIGAEFDSNVLNYLCIGDEFIHFNQKETVFLKHYEIVECDTPVMCYTLDVEHEEKNKFFVDPQWFSSVFEKYCQQ